MDTDYPTVKIPLRQLYYRWDHPREVIHSSVLAKYLSYETKLKDKVHELVASRNPWGMLYISIRNQGLVNPLIVKRGEGDELEGKFFVVVGNQRLAVLRAMAHHARTHWNESERLIPCLVAKPEDDWTDSTPARHQAGIVSMGFNPYKKCWQKDPPNDGWNKERDG
jgi:hypothetical protein